MERGDWDNDADYPRAPLPAHERTWRHPSEMGNAQWVRAEPPLIVGRGLTVAAGTLGAVLALGLLWMMVPHPGHGSGVAVEVSATSVRVSPPAVTPPPSRGLSATTPPSASVAGSTPATMTVASDISITTAANIMPAATSAVPSVPPIPTMLLDSGDEISMAIPPVAVALTPGHYVVTTAAAVRGRQGFAVQLPSGETVVGAVVAVDVANGTAVLSVTTEVDATMIEASQSDLSAGGFVVMTPEATSANLWEDDEGTKVSYDNDDSGADTGEGSLVVDSDGRLMGMCTKSGSGVQLVTVATLLEALAAASANGTPAWLGIEADLNAAQSVAVTQVLDGGPAAAAGLRVGDVIVSIDGVPLTDLETLRTIISARAAGETVTLTIQRPPVDPTTTTIAGTTSTTLAASTSTVPASASTNGANTASTAATPANLATSTSAPATSSSGATNTTNTTNTMIVPNTTIDVMVTLSQQPGSL